MVFPSISFGRKSISCPYSSYADSPIALLCISFLYPVFFCIFLLITAFFRAFFLIFIFLCILLISAFSCILSLIAASPCSLSLIAASPCSLFLIAVSPCSLLLFLTAPTLLSRKNIYILTPAPISSRTAETTSHISSSVSVKEKYALTRKNEPPSSSAITVTTAPPFVRYRPSPNSGSCTFSFEKLCSYSLSGNISSSSVSENISFDAPQAVLISCFSSISSSLKTAFGLSSAFFSISLMESTSLPACS